MVTTVGLSSDFTEVVNDLIRLDYDAIEAYQEAIMRIENETFKSMLREFAVDHHRHTQELSEIARQLGVNPASGPGAKQYLAKGKVVIADLFGDKAILMAMKTNEKDTNTAYERALDHEDVPVFARETIQRGLSDERRHLAWIEDTLDRM